MQVLGNAVLILPDKQPQKTRSGNIFIPETTKGLMPEEGTIIQAGPACEEVKAGMHVIFERKTASIADIDGIIHYFTNEDKIKFIYE